MTERKTPAAFRDPRALAGLPADAPLCVGLSGGADSVALLCMLRDDPHLSAVHVHHGIRGAEADRDADFCKDLTERLGIPFTLLRIDAPALADADGMGLEEAARVGRYAALTAHMRKNGIPLLVTAHHAGDQLETMLQHLLRGSGLGGLCGIPACRPLGNGLWVARPLLSLTREELRDYLRENEMDFVEDSTNFEGSCTRNRLRLEVLPVLEELYGGSAKAAARCAEILCEDEAYLRGLAADFIEKEGLTPTVAALSSLPRPVFARVMQELLPKAPQRVHIEALEGLCRKGISGTSLSLPDCTVTLTGSRLTVSVSEETVSDLEILLQKGENPFPGGRAWLFAHGEEPPIDRYLHTYTTQISLDPATIKGELRLRNRRTGDRILQGGMHREVRRLEHLLPLPLSLRLRLPMLCDDEGIVAIPLAEKGKPLYRDGCFWSDRKTLQILLQFD